jgi:hypothetical protein
MREEIDSHTFSQRMGTIPLAARVFDPKEMENETKISISENLSTLHSLNKTFKQSIIIESISSTCTFPSKHFTTYYEFTSITTLLILAYAYALDL